MSVSTALPTITPTYSNSTGAASASLVLDFNKVIAAGTGLITITDGATQTYMGKDGTLRTRLIGATDTRTIDITDTSKVTISGDTVTIRLDTNLSPGKSYSVQMAAGVLQDEDGNAYAGLTDTSKLPFATSTTAIPSAVVDSGITLSADTGASATDFITKNPAQTISGKYSGTLAAGDSVRVSLDNGGTWIDATVDADSHTWSAAGTLTGSSTVVARVTDAAGHFSLAARQAYTFDTDAPTVASITVADADLVAGETTTVTIAFNEAVTGLQIADFNVTGGTLSNLASSVDGQTWTATLTPTMGVANGSGQITLKASGVDDIAGNSGPANDTTQSFNYSTVPNAPTATVATIRMTDSGSSSSDFITNATTQSISGTYTGTLATDEYVEVSLDNGATWTKATTSGSAWSIPSTTISASNTLKARVTNGYTYSNPLAEGFTLDQAAPTVGVTLADSALTVGKTSLVTIKFSEAVTGFTNDDITVANGTLSTVASADGGITWTATFTPGASTTDATNVITVNKAGVADIAGNAGSGSTSSANYTVDTVRPTVSSISLADTALTAGETTTVTFTFSEAVTEFSTADVTVDNGTLSSLSSADGGTTWTATLTPTALVHDNTNSITLDNTGITDLAGNAGSGAKSSDNYTVSTKRPTATIAIADTTLTAGESTTVTITFSEAVTELPTSALSVGHGALSSLTSADGGVTWTGTLTPSTSAHATTNVITLSNSVIKNMAGNTGTGTTSSANYTVATVRPTAAIAVSDTALKVGDTATVTVTFSEAVSGLEAADFTVANGTLTTPVSSDNGITWTATLTPTSSIEDTTNVITLDNTGVKDSDGNTGAGTTSSGNYTVDTKLPTASISLSDASLTTGQTTTVTVTFSEAVSSSTFTSSDITVDGGTLGTFTSTDNITWTATLTPSTTGDGSGSVQLAASSITDTAGNSGPAEAASASFTYVVPPTVTIASLALSADTGDSGSDFITKTAAQTITGTLSAALGSSEFVEVSLDGGSTWTNASVSGTSWSLSGQTLGSSSTLIARVSNADATGTELSQAYTLDQAAPTATIALAQSDLLTGETTTVTVTFDQAVTGLTLDDFKYSGAMTAPVSSDGGITWTATLTPSTSGAGEVRLDASSVTDVAGNSGPSSDTSASFTYNATPTATIATASMTDTNISGDFITSSTSQVVSGTLSASLGRGQYVEVSLDNGATWTQATTSGTSWSLSGQTISTSSTLKVRASNGSATGTEYSHSYTLDQTAPGWSSINLSKSSMITGQTATVTVVFDEAVYDLDATDFTVSGGTLGTFSTTDHITWTGTLTPTASGSVALSASAVTDAAGNVGPASSSSSQSFTFTVDNTGPTATLTLSDNTLSKGQTATLTMTLSEAVTDTPTASDFTVTGGTLGAFTTTDSGLTWTATLTPTDGAYGAGSITLAANAINDPSGNPGPSSSASLPFNYDTQTLTLSSSIAFSTDNGDSGSDLITNTGTQTISGSFSGGSIYSTMGDKIEVSTDNGSTWSSATVDNTAHTWSISKTLSGSSTIQVRLTDGTGTAGTPVSHTYTIDTTGPGSLAGKTPDLYFSSDTYNSSAGGSQSDNITNDDTPTITFSLASSGLTAGDYVDVLDTSDSNAILGTYTIESSALGAYGSSIFVTPTAALTEGTHTLVLRARDTAGNTGTQSSSLSISIDKTIASMAGKTLDLDAASDTGYLSTDNITNDNTPTITVNVASTSGLSADDVLQIIDTSNGNAVVGTSRALTATDYGASGGDISIPLSSLTDGTHALALRAVDKAGNTGTASTSTLSVKIDTTAPTILSASGYSSPYNGETDVAYTSPDIKLKFSEALYVYAHKGIEIVNSSNSDYTTGYTFEQGASSIEYDDVDTITVHSSTLTAGTTYNVNVYNEYLEDLAGNTVANGTKLLDFTTYDPTPSAPTLSLTDTNYASGGSSSDHLTRDATLTVTGLTATRFKYSTTGGDSWADEAVTGSTMTFTLGAGTYSPGQIIVKQYSDSSYVSTGGTLSDTWTIDTTGPSAYVTSASLPNFFGLGTSIPISLITGSLSAALGSGEYLEYTTDDGSTWSTATTLLTGWSITSVGIAAGGAIGLRVTDTAGNISSYESFDSYTLYVGDGYAGTFTATGDKQLFAMGGNDTITISGSGNDIDGGYGADTITVGGTENTVTGGADADTITINGSDNDVDGDAGDDTITVNATGNWVDAGYGADTVTVSISVSDLSGTITGGSDSDSSDTLVLSASHQELDLTPMGESIAHFEKIQLASNDQITITPESAASMSDAASLYILGDSTNTIYLSGSWTSTAAISLYSAYTNTDSGITVYFRSTMASAVTPSTTIDSMALSSDTGASASDFITNATSQTISGTLSAVLASGQTVQVSLDNGDTWVDASATVGSRSWSLSGQTLSASNTLLARVANGPLTGAEYSQEYTLDQTAPVATIELSQSALLTGDTATVTITFCETPNGFTLSDLTTSSGTISSLTATNDPLVYTATLTPSINGSGTVQLTASGVTDTAGNSLASDASASFTFNAVPSATIATAGMTDTGSSSSDFITKSASQTISGTLSASLANGEYVQVSLDNGSSWTTATTSDTSWTLSGQTISADNTLVVRVTNGATTGTEYSHAYTLDQTSPSASVSTSTTFDTTGSSAALTITGDVTGTLGSGEFVEYTKDNGSTWTEATSTTSTSFTLGGVTGITGGMIGLRVSDTAGNTNESMLEHTIYIGDSNGATFTTTNDMWVYTGGGADNGTIAGSGNQVYTYGGIDTLNVSGSSNTVFSGDGNDIISVTGSYNAVQAGDGADTITFTGALSGSLYGGSDSNSDTLVLSTASQSLSLSTMSSYAHEFEVIQLGSNSTLTLSASATANMSDTAYFKVIGDANNHVYVNYGEWTLVTTADGFKEYTNTTYGMTMLVSAVLPVEVIAA